MRAGIPNNTFRVCSGGGPRYPSTYKHRPHDPDDYEILVPALALTGTGQSLDRLLERALLALDLPTSTYAYGRAYAVLWCSTVGQLARRARRDKRLPLRRFLQTFHLGIIREASLALPFVLCEVSRQSLGTDELEDAACGLALMELAAFYNSLARQQRDPVLFAASSAHPAFGPLLQAPSRGAEWGFDILDRFYRGIRLREWRIRRAWDTLDSLGKELQERTGGSQLRGQALIQRDVLGPYSPDTLDARARLAFALWQAGQADDAISIEEETVNDLSRVFGADDPETLVARENLGFSYRQAGRADEAFNELQELLYDRRRLLGPDHIQTRRTELVLDVWRQQGTT